MEIVGEKLGKITFLQKQGLFCYGSPWQAYFSPWRRFVLCITRHANFWLAMARITGPDTNFHHGE
jgi:hypothetical protein